MKNIKMFAAIAVAAIAAMSITSSCSKEEWSTTHLGIDQEFKGNENPGEEGMRYENTDLSLEFDTLAYQLFTVEQRVYGEKVVFQGEDVLGTESFSRDLNLEVNFSLTPEKVYVAEESLLNEVSLKSQNSSDTTSSEVADEEFTVISYSRDYSFAFNANEKVSASAVWQALKSVEPDTTFAYAEVASVSYNKFEAKENSELSNTDSTVFDIDLFFDVEVVCESLEFDSVYAVRLPYLRIYKGGEMPDQFFWVVENESYTAEFDTTVCELFTVRQEISGEEVLYNNEEELSRSSFTKDLNLNALFSVKPEVRYVASEDGIEEISLSSASKGERTSSNEADGRFTTTSYEQEYSFLFNKGEKVSVATIYQKLAYGDTTFNYASIKDVSFKEAASEVVTNTDSTICNIDLYFNVEVEKQGVEETFVVRVPLQRIYKPGEMPDQFFWVIENESYTAEFDTTACELFTVRQEISGEEVLYNNEEELSRSSFTKDLNLNAKFSVKPEVRYVSEENGIEEISLSSSSKGERTSSNEEDGRFTTTSIKQGYEFLFNGGEKVSVATVYQKLMYGDTTFNYASIKDISFKEAANEVVKTADSTICNIDLYFNVEVEKQGVEETFVVRVPMTRIYKPGAPDEYETKVENTDYEAEFAVANLALETKLQNISGELVVYKNGEEEISRDEFLKALNLEALFTQPERVYVESEAQLTAVSLNTSSHSADVVKKTADGRFVTSATSLDYNFKFNEGEAVKAGVNYEKLAYGDTTFVYSMIKSIRFKKSEVSENAAASNDELRVVNVTLYFDVEVEREYPMATTKAASEDVTVYTVAVPYERAMEIEPVVDEIIGKRYEDVSRIIVDANTERISWTEVEVWSVSGEKSREISLNLYRHFSEPALQWIYTANNQYTTVANGSSIINETSSQQGNWTVTTRYMQYTSTANNGVTPFQNVYSYDLQKAVYSDEYYTLSFDYADWQIVEAGSSVSTTPTRETINGTVYDVYDYINNINTVYAITGDSYEATAKAEAKIAILPRILPENWGKIIGAGISAVPADDENPGDYAKKCLVIRTENGAVAVPFAMSESTPEVNNILAGYFVEGNFGEEYNSGYFTTSANHGSYAVGKWAPAIAQYHSDEYPILYYSDVNTPVRSLSKYILAMWNWRGGNFSHVVDGYTFSVSESGVLTITYNGETVMQLR